MPKSNVATSNWMPNKLGMKLEKHKEAVQATFDIFSTLFTVKVSELINTMESTKESFFHSKSSDSQE